MSNEKAREIIKLGALFAIMGALSKAPWAGGFWPQVALYASGAGLLSALIFTLFEREDECDCECTCDDVAEAEAK